MPFTSVDDFLTMALIVATAFFEALNPLADFKGRPGWDKVLKRRAAACLVLVLAFATIQLDKGLNFVDDSAPSKSNLLISLHSTSYATAHDLDSLPIISIARSLKVVDRPGPVYYPYAVTNESLLAEQYFVTIHFYAKEAQSIIAALRVLAAE